jgi:hypothetical protein
MRSAVTDEELVRHVYERIRAQVWDADDGDDDDAALRRLTREERAIYATMELEDELAEGGWSFVFANADDGLIEPAIDGYELLGLRRYAALLRAVRRDGYTDLGPESAGERFDARFERLSGADRARARLIRRMAAEG